MSKNIFITLTAIIIALVSCKEVPQEVILDPSQLALFDTTYISTSTISSVPNNVMIEEFSGVRCNNCPKGNVITHDLHSANPQRVTIVTVHSDFLANPYTGDQDLRTPDADALAAIGAGNSKPSTYINRKKLEDPSTIKISGAGTAALNAWAPYVNSELALMTPIDLKLELVYSDVVERKFRYRVEVGFAQDMTNINLGFLLTENAIITQQRDGVVDIENYEHEWVLRDYITSVLGEPLNEDLLANTVIIKEFEVDLDDFEQANSNSTNPIDWKIDNMELVAFLRASDESIINVAKVEL